MTEILENYTGFEQGPIRPPSEAGSLLLRVSRNCPWNKCTFCAIYKGQKFSKRPVEHIMRDIDIVHGYVEKMLELQGSSPFSRFEQLKNQPDFDAHAFHAAYNFVSNGMKSIFLQDGNSFVLKPDELVRILEHVRLRFPDVDRVTSYARSKSIARISDEDLLRIRKSGLNRIHIGMESGSDAVLKKVKKGVDKETQIIAGQKVKLSGMQLSEYWMPGLGGRSLSRENALETADALNQINPDFIRLRTLALPFGAPITEEYKAGEFDKMGEVETAQELLLMLEALDGISSTIRSDHVLNLFQEVDGNIPEDKEKIMTPIKDYLALPAEEQMLFSIGRRTRRFARFTDLQNPELRSNAQRMCAQLGATAENMDEIVERITKQFI
ncbi:radical SAM protein [Desulfovibrio sp. JC010]|uniref:radical SAM protein n=1 Tax=Desulfovibrio sp. JC010 TaxID=2593641 RepID=UPI0013D4D01A|nr:radical SAM protein [Desulfovibrio sp. JC010]NDV27545.1 radical SAM protein [Desulfovibrio sp. JC010]